MILNQSYSNLMKLQLIIEINVHHNDIHTLYYIIILLSILDNYQIVQLQFYYFKRR